jgi:hypothetical protein
MKTRKKLFVIRKYVMAKDVIQAIRIERHQKPDDVWLDDDWKKANAEEPTATIGFKTNAKGKQTKT